MIVHHETLSHPHAPQTTYLQVWQHAQNAINQVRQKLKNKCTEPRDFQRARKALQCLPIAQNEFALASCRLHNAENYFGESETGAAVYELNLLYGGLCREQECTTNQKLLKSHY